MLKKLQKRLVGLNGDVQIRGDGKSQFLYITSNNKSIEVSIDKNGNYWLEYWNDSLDENAESVKEDTINDISVAETEIKKWFQ